MTRWLVTGAGGQVGSVLLRRLVNTGADAIGMVSPSGPRPAVGASVAVDLLDSAATSKALDRILPTCIVHCAAISSMGAAFADPERAQRVNVEVTERLAELTRRRGQRLILLSTDMVFDGEHAPYDESAVPRPHTRYGETKRAAEQVLAQHDNALVLRLPLLYGLPAVERSTTFRQQVEQLLAGGELRLFSDEYRTPLWLDDAAAAIERAAAAPLTGVLHVPGPERLSRLEMGKRLATALGIDGACIRSVTRAEFEGPEPRPRDLSLSSRRHASVFEQPPGRPMAEALQAITSRLRGPHRTPPPG